MVTEKSILAMLMLITAFLFQTHPTSATNILLHYVVDNPSVDFAGGLQLNYKLLHRQY